MKAEHGPSSRRSLRSVIMLALKIIKQMEDEL